MLKIEKQENENQATIILEGEATIDYCEDLAKELKEIIASQKKLIINANALQNIDAACLQAIIASKKECESQNIEFSFIADSFSINNILRISGLENLKTKQEI